MIAQRSQEYTNELKLDFETQKKKGASGAGNKKATLKKGQQSSNSSANTKKSGKVCLFMFVLISVHV